MSPLPAIVSGRIRVLAIARRVAWSSVDRWMPASRDRSAAEPHRGGKLTARVEIDGKELRISEATVKTHLLHIFAKLSVDDRTAAVTAAIEWGVLRLEK